MRYAVVGAGSVGARVARSLAGRTDSTTVFVQDVRAERAARVVAAVGGPAEVCDDAVARAPDVTVVCTAGGTHASIGERALEAGSHVVSTSDRMSDVESLLALDDRAVELERTLLVGVGFSPGLSCLLSRHASRSLDAVEEIHVARFGTGGPACARQHHDSLAGRVVDWRDGRWVDHPGGSGRELCWFPDPIGAADCYRAGLPDALLLAPAFPGVVRVTARVAANRRDRTTARLPMLRRPHRDGGPGATRVEVRGRVGTARRIVVLGALERPAAGAAVMAAELAASIAEGRIDRAGARGVAAAVDDARPVLAALAEAGVTAARFEGAT